MQELIALVKPIKRDLLIHSVMYHEKKIPEDGIWGGSSSGYKAPILVERVRIEPKTTLSRNANGETVESNTTMYVDAVSSTEANWVFDSKIVWEGKDFFIKSVFPFYARENVVHHWEVHLA